MNYKDFDNNFLFISRSNKRDEGNLTPSLYRPIIGKNGIGFVSASIICDEMIVISSKKGNHTNLKRSLILANFEKPNIKKKRNYALVKNKR